MKGYHWNMPSRKVLDWTVTPAKIAEAVERIVAAERPRRVVLFGSAASPRSGTPADADFLIVTATDESPGAASVRIRRLLRGIEMPIDVVVISEERLNELAETPGLVFREALRKGRVLYEAA